MTALAAERLLVAGAPSSWSPSSSFSLSRTLESMWRRTGTAITTPTTSRVGTLPLPYPRPRPHTPPSPRPRTRPCPRPRTRARRGPRHAHAHAPAQRQASCQSGRHSRGGEDAGGGVRRGPVRSAGDLPVHAAPDHRPCDGHGPGLSACGRGRKPPDVEEQAAGAQLPGLLDAPQLLGRRRRCQGCRGPEDGRPVELDRDRRLGMFIFSRWASHIVPEARCCILQPQEVCRRHSWKREQRIGRSLEPEEQGSLRHEVQGGHNGAWLPGLYYRSR